MLGLAFACRVAALRNVRRFAQAAATATKSTGTAVDRANHILALSGPTSSNESSLTYQQKEFLQSLGANPKTEDIELAFKVYEKVLDLSKGVDKFSCAKLSLLCLNGGMPDRALEPWARLLEVLGSRVTSPRSLELILNLPEFEPAALAALAAYFVMAGPAADAKVAHKLVPRNRIPNNLSILRGLGGIKSKDAEEITLRGLASLQKLTTNNYTDPAFLSRVASAPFAELNQLWNQIELISKPNEIPEVCYAAFIRRLAETRQSQRAFGLWQQLVQSGVPITTLGWSSLLRAALCAPKNAESLFEGIWNKMIANGFTPDSACNTERLLCLTRHKNAEEALKFFKTLQEKHPRDIESAGLTIIVSSLARAKRLEEADEILQWAIENKIEPSEYTYNALISAGKPETSARYLQQMIERGIKPSIVTYTFAMQQLLKRGQPIDELLSEMADAKIEPNERFNTTLAYYMGRKTEDLSLARSTMQNVIRKRIRLNIETLGAFIELELRHGDIDKAVEYLDLMKKFGLTPNLPTYNQVLKGAIRRGRLDVVRSLFDKMVDGPILRLRPNHYTYMTILQPWTPGDFENNQNVRALVQHVASHIDQLNQLEFSLAKQILAIAQATGTELVSKDLIERSSKVELDQFDPKLAKKA